MVMVNASMMFLLEHGMNVTDFVPEKVSAGNTKLKNVYGNLN